MCELGRFGETCGNSKPLPVAYQVLTNRGIRNTTEHNTDSGGLVLSLPVCVCVCTRVHDVRCRPLGAKSWTKLVRNFIHHQC